MSVNFLKEKPLNSQSSFTKKGKSVRENHILFAEFKSVNVNTNSLKNEFDFH